MKSKTARHKLAKYLKDNAHLLPSHLKSGSAEEGAGEAAAEDGQKSALEAETEAAKNTFRLDVVGDDGPGLLVQLASIISKHGHDVKVGPSTVLCSAWALYPLLPDANPPLPPFPHPSSSFPC